MRILFVAGLTGLALVSLAGCNKPATAPTASSGPASGAGSAPAASAPAASGPLTPGQVPHRKAGLWKQDMTMDGAPAGPGMQLCVDDASEARMSAFAQRRPRGARCDTPRFSRNLDGSISFSEVCDMGANGKTTTTGTFRGDFNTGYTGDMDTEYSGGPSASLNGRHKMTITATWTGPCPAGDRGGDMIMGNGMKMNALDRMAPQGGGDN